MNFICPRCGKDTIVRHCTSKGCEWFLCKCERTKYWDSKTVVYDLNRRYFLAENWKPGFL